MQFLYMVFAILLFGIEGCDTNKIYSLTNIDPFRVYKVRNRNIKEVFLVLYYHENTYPAAPITTHKIVFYTHVHVFEKPTHLEKKIHKCLLAKIIPTRDVNPNREKIGIT